MLHCPQVIADYCRYADVFVGRWAVTDTYRDPCIRTLARPILNLFHGERGSKKWKQAVDKLLKKDPRTLSEVRPDVFGGAGGGAVYCSK